jgi:hypothetical protein
MTNTISGSYNTLVSLASAIDNPTTLTTSAMLNYGLQISYAGLTATNAGTITTGTTSAGVALLAGGNIANQRGGAISGYLAIYAENDAVTVVNAGSITGFNFNVEGTGIRLLAGGSVTNQSGGSIYGAYGIFDKNGAVTVVNAGDITGTVALAME